jgi:hypothetical protein
MTNLIKRVILFPAVRRYSKIFSRKQPRLLKSQEEKDPSRNLQSGLPLLHRLKPGKQLLHPFKGSNPPLRQLKASKPETQPRAPR